MKILIVVTKSELGGAQVFALHLAKGLKAQGEEVTVAGGPGEYLPLELTKAQIPFYRFQNLERSYNPLKIFKFITELKDYIKTNNFTVVHLNSSNALFGVWGLSKLNPKPKVIFTVHGLSFLDPNHHTNLLISYLYQVFFKTAWRRIDSLVFVSRLNYENALSRKLMKRGEVIYNGLDLGSDFLLSREEARRILGEKIKTDLSDAYLYGSIGRLAYPKNYEFLINSFLEVKKIKTKAKLLLIGEGPERVKYEFLVKSYNLENDVYLGGELLNASSYLKAFDLFVLPSIFEGMSLSLIEAVLAGVPALASHVGGSEEIVGAVNCFELDNQGEFLEKIKTVQPVNVSDSRFDLNKMVQAYLKVYNI